MARWPKNLQIPIFIKEEKRNKHKHWMEKNKNQRDSGGYRNKKKLAEIKELTKDFGLKVLSLEDFRMLPMLGEDGKTF